MHAAYDRAFQTPSFENILLASSPDVVALNPQILRLPIEPSHGNYYEMGMTKGFGKSDSMPITIGATSTTSPTTTSCSTRPSRSPSPFAKPTSMVQKGRSAIPNWGRFSGFVSYSYMVGSAYFPVTGGLFLGQDATNALTQLGGRFWVSQDQRNTVRARFRYQFKPWLWGAAGADYGSGLPVDFDGTYEQALAEYGQQVIDRVNFNATGLSPTSR